MWCGMADESYLVLFYTLPVANDALVTSRDSFVTAGFSAMQLSRDHP